MKALLALVLAACTAQAGTYSQASVTDPWTPHVVYDGLVGADGVDLADVDGNGLVDIVSPWEQSNKVTVSLQGPAGVWNTSVVVTSFTGAEDAAFADVDGDGNLDVIAAAEAGKRVAISFGPNWSPSIKLTASSFQRWMRVAWAGGRLYGGGKVAPATVGYFTPVGNPRVAANWVYTAIGDVGWTAGMFVRDVDGDQDLDVVLSDRQNANSALNGTRWLENAGAVYVNHEIGHGGGGEYKMFSIPAVGEVWDCRSSAAYNAITRRITSDWVNWTAYPLPMPTGVGQCHDVQAGDIDGDGSLDIVMTFSNATGALSGVVWVDANGQRHEVSGAPGEKYDNAYLQDMDGDGDLDIVTSEQTELQAVLWYENPR